MTTLPAFGLRIGNTTPPTQCVPLAKAADQAGLAAVWFAENAFGRGALPAAAACAAATKRVRIGMGVWNPYNRHPTLMAMEIGALDELSGGRAALGIGSGIAAATTRMGLDGSKPLAALRDSFSIVRGMLNGQAVTHDGRAFSAAGAKLDYAPPRPDMPILMAARGDKALALCGELADGLMISNACPPGFTVNAVAAMRAGAQAAGRVSPAQVVQYVPCVARRDRAEALRIIQHEVADMVASFWTLAQRVPATKAALLCADDLDADDFETATTRLKNGECAADVVDERFLRAFALAGSAEDCLVQAETYAKAGVTELVLTFIGDQPDADIAYLGASLS